MAWKAVAAIVGLIELLAPKQVANFWLATCCKNSEEIELRSWIGTAVRIEGLMLLGWALWDSRDEMGGWIELDDFDVSDADVPAVEIESTEEEEESDTDLPSLQAGTTRFNLAAALYHSDDPLSVSELVERSEGSDWEVGRSTTSATLYRMHRDGLVDRRERDDARGYEYWLADLGGSALEAVETSLDPEPFVPSE